MGKALLSRREFLQTSAGAAGASLAARSTFLESESFAATGQTNGPSDRVRFGIVGVGMEGSVDDQVRMLTIDRTNGGLVS
jgi:hypothetical protein